MRQRLICLLSVLALFLSGCAELRGSYADEFSLRVQSALTRPALRPNYSHGNYSYYKEPLLGRIDATETSNTFSLNRVPFVMNLKVSSIINQKFYDGISNSSAPNNLNMIATATGTLLDYQGQEHPYRITSFELGSDVYTYAETDQVEFFGISSQLEALQLAETMMYIARSVKVETEEVISTYSSRQSIEYSRKRLELFHNIVPENGVIDELFEGNGNYAGQMDGDYFGDNIDREETPSQDIDLSQGDADDNIGGEIEDVDRGEEAVDGQNSGGDTIG